MKYLLLILLILTSCNNKDHVTVDSIQIKNGEKVVVNTFDVTQVKMENVESSAIAYIGYKNENLIIVFNSSLDRCYVYSDVPYDDYRDLINAESIGGYYNKHIKNVYDEAIRIDDIYVSNGHIKYKE